MDLIDEIIIQLESTVKDQLSKTERRIADSLVRHGRMYWKKVGTEEVLCVSPRND